MGDETCASCHGDLYEAYHRTGMGRSVSRFDPATAPERFDGETTIYNATFDYYYEPLLRGDTLYQREYRRGPDGTITHDLAFPTEWVIGSGNATRSYLMNVNGHITEMPLTWYVERQQWDMSPAYTQTNFRFSRPIEQECMTCHNGLPEHSAYSIDHYTEVPLGITCERCHGPGGAHVEARLAGLEPPAGEPDPDIVNPAHLSRDLQLDVCQQCHLTGTTVFKDGEDPATYRPGETLAAHRSVFVTTEQRDDPERFGIASHAQRLALSACYQLSEMTCVTCHNPHQPVAELGPEAFNEACLTCHSPTEDPDEQACSRPEAATLAEAMTGNCVSCHLQKSGTSDIPHVTFTDHWIRRTLPPAIAPDDIERALVRDRPFQLVRLEGATDNPAQAQLEEGMAYFQFYETRHELPAYLPDVIANIRAGLAAGAEHPDARVILGRALAASGQRAAALAALREATDRYPDNARAHYHLGEALLGAQQPAAATAALQRARDLQPSLIPAYVLLGEALLATNRPALAEQVLQEGIDRNPIHYPNLWNDLGFLLLSQNRLDEAEPLLQRATELDPDRAVAWVNRATVPLLREDYAAALPLLRQALQADPDYVAAYGNLGAALLQLGQYAEAEEQFRQVLARAPGDARAQALLRQAQQSRRQAN